MPNEDANIALVRRIFHEGTNIPNSPAETAEIFARDFVCHGPPGVNHAHSEERSGPEHCMLLDAFEDVVFTLSEVTSEGDQEKCHFSASVVQIADYMGVKPSGRPGRLKGVTTFRVEDGKIREGWGVLSWG